MAIAQIANANIAARETAGFFLEARITANLSTGNPHAAGAGDSGDEIVATV